MSPLFFTLALVAAGPQWLGPPHTEAPTRIVSLAPSATEFICALQACDKLVGVTKFDDYPAEVTRLPKIGGFVDPSVETVLGLKPDLVVAIPTSGGRQAVDTLARLGVSVLVLPNESLDDVWQALAALGKALHKEARAQEETARLKSALAPVKADAKADVPTLAVVVVGRKPMVVVGPGTFLDTLLNLAGGHNAVVRGPAYPIFDLEALAKLDPDVIIDTSGTMEGSAHDFWRSAGFLKAVRNGRVAEVSDPAVVRPGPRLDQGLTILRQALRGGTRAP